MSIFENGSIKSLSLGRKEEFKTDQKSLVVAFLRGPVNLFYYSLVAALRKDWTEPVA